MKGYSLGSLMTAMVTPFDNGMAVDYDRAAALADRLCHQGSQGIVVAGTTGESPTLSHQEKLDLFRVVKDAVKGRASVVAGTGSNCTADTVTLTREAEEIGVDAALLVCPYYNRPPQEGLYQHFKTVADNTSLPCILYNIPGRTGRLIEASTTIRLAEVENIVGTKEASGDYGLIASVRAKTSEDFAIWSGDDGATLHVMAVGGCGVISVAAHLVGPQMRELIAVMDAGNLAKATEIHLRLLPFFNSLFIPTSVNPAPVKAALQLAGFDCGSVRLPLVAVTEKERAFIADEMKRQGLL